MDHMSFVAIWKCNVLRCLWITDFFFFFSIYQFFNASPNVYCTWDFAVCVGAAWNLIVVTYELEVDVFSVILYWFFSLRPNSGKRIAWGREFKEPIANHRLSFSILRNLDSWSRGSFLSIKSIEAFAKYKSWHYCFRKRTL